jgi:nucleotide-binding universal stress UspA family protein
MSFATMMVSVDPQTASSTRVQFAIDLADRFTATLIGVSGQGLMPIVADGGAGIMPAQFAEDEYEQIMTDLALRQSWFHKTTEKSRVPTEWRSAVEPPTSLLAREARAADLIIVGQQRSFVDFTRVVDPADMVLRAGRPVLAVPPGTNTLNGKSVLIAWKDVRESRRAIQDSLPFLHEAEKVIVAEISEGDTDADEARKHLEDVVHYLARHRIKASAWVPTSNGKPVEVLLDLAKKEAIGLIVAGAYGHSRVGEWLFGGVTKALLNTSPVPCLFSH